MNSLSDWDSRPTSETSRLINLLAEMCLTHDHSYHMSDDYSEYRRGAESINKIKTFVKDNNIPPKVATIIFNREAIRKFPSAAHLFWIKEEAFN